MLPARGAGGPCAARETEAHWWAGVASSLTLGNLSPAVPPTTSCVSPAWSLHPPTAHSPDCGVGSSQGHSALDTLHWKERDGHRLRACRDPLTPGTNLEGRVTSFRSYNLPEVTQLGPGLTSDQGRGRVCDSGAWTSSVQDLHSSWLLRALHPSPCRVIGAWWEVQRRQDVGFSRSGEVGVVQAFRLQRIDPGAP